MNKKGLKTVFGLVILCLIACDSPITFTEPQPHGIKDLSELPRRLQGEYINLKDSSILIISDKVIQSICDFDLISDSADSTTSTLNDTIITSDIYEGTSITIRINDTLKHHHVADTVFQTNSDHVLRKFKGYYFISTRYGENNWEVKRINLLKGQLFISSISTEKELENLKVITESPMDTIPPYNFSATKKQFKKFIKDDSFKNMEVFAKRK
ncbi:MAG: hypothetical protein ABI772_12390 [Bacteroidota bacterium]